METGPIFERNHGLTFLEKCQFFDFFNFFFLLPRKAFFRSRISWNRFSWPILSEKKKLEKGPIFEHNHGLTPLENVSFSTFWTGCFYCLERRLFVLEYHKTHFTYLYCLKKKVGKMTNFRAKPWVNPFGKMSIFRLFELLVFIA